MEIANRSCLVNLDSQLVSNYEHQLITHPRYIGSIPPLKQTCKQTVNSSRLLNRDSQLQSNGD